MATTSKRSRSCFLALPEGPDSPVVDAAVRKAVSDAGFRISATDDAPLISSQLLRERRTEDVARADCVIADVTGRSRSVIFYLGISQGMGKPLFLLVRRDSRDDVPLDLRGFEYIDYEPTEAGLEVLSRRLSRSLREFVRTPRRLRGLLSTNAPAFFVDWDRLDATDAENLCRELLVQMGFQRVDWAKDLTEVELVAELPRRDPDGFEYRDLWLIAWGRNTPIEVTADLVMRDPEYFLHRVTRSSERFERFSMVRGAAESAITLLLVELKPVRAVGLDEIRSLLDQKIRRSRAAGNLRVRMWDQSYLTVLLQQYPHLGYKYFSDEARSRSGHRKSHEELSRENAQMAERLMLREAALEEEKNRRVRAERDAVWKDISFSAAHKIGNPIFAIETNLDPLNRRIDQHRTEEALDVVASIRVSVEKAKAIVDQFKSLTRAQEITVADVALRPLLEECCNLAVTGEVTCSIDCPDDLWVEADSERLAECFDELVHNSLQWFDKHQREINVVATANPSAVPQQLDSSRRYAVIHFRDSGQGIPVDRKEKIFDAFYTTHQHGTGLGLALVRRIVEGNKGMIIETGVPGVGADFEIYLPLARREERRDGKGIPGDGARS